jgi:hypothetical protein
MGKAIRFHYLFRDSGNYKKFGHKDFSNPNKLTIEEISRQIRDSLIDSEFFYPEKVGIQKFLFHRYCDDYAWYEFERVEEVLARYPHENIEHFIFNLTH